MFVRKLTETDAEAYQAIRLMALTINPEAFGSTYEREAAFSIEDVRQRIKPSAKQCVLGAFDMSGTLIGIVTLIRESGKKTSHKANVYGLFVSDNQRGNGIGRALMEALLSEARRMDGLEQLNLSVAADNAGAIKLYQAMGFRSYGLEYRSLKANGYYADEYLMTYWLLEDNANKHPNLPYVSGLLNSTSLQPQSSNLVIAEWTAEGTTSGEEPMWIAPLHRHLHDDEAWYVLEGRLGFRIGEHEFVAGPNEAVVVPGGIAHTYWNPDSEPTKYLIMMTSRVNKLIESIHQLANKDRKSLERIFREHDSELL